MVNTFNIWNRPIYTILVSVLLTAFVAKVLSVSFDVSERIWHLTQPLETWQLDELLIAISISAIVGLIVAFQQISAFTKQLAEPRA